MVINHVPNIPVQIPPSKLIDKHESISIKEEEMAPEPIRRSHKLDFNNTPFPKWLSPTAEECEEVARLLSNEHGDVKAPKEIPPPSLTVTGCGEVPCVLDALIRTFLSGATTSTNAAMAFQGLVQKFGILQAGVGKGSVDWDKVRQASVKDIRDAIRSGGLADTKSKRIKKILEMVHAENIERRERGKADSGNEGVLSLDYMHDFTKDEAMQHFIKYPGVGVKTAACVVLFCLRRPCFAVDTHVFRLSKWLGWVPPEKVNEIAAFRHLEARVPDHLKYSLHQLFLFHGKQCGRCRAATSVKSEVWAKGCVVEHLVKRTGKRKIQESNDMPQARLNM
ncbi:Meiotic Sister-Chromatid recombination aldehyde dehydrogenase [Ophidiomyces ophidiicola]|nr:Meiotic Sister-Chromatid recombination aldehyde dehydrogenase [Ophidiomyces ophidiicola]KAI1942526.1 Meiotic Sister-Chromatid recombination aldehyde dehydrogenase [Ophidiomyces ophidiicola]